MPVYFLCNISYSFTTTIISTIALNWEEKKQFYCIHVSAIRFTNKFGMMTKEQGTYQDASLLPPTSTNDMVCAFAQPQLLRCAPSPSWNKPGVMTVGTNEIGAVGKKRRFGAKKRGESH